MSEELHAHRLGEIFRDARQGVLDSQGDGLRAEDERQVFQLWRDRSDENWGKILSGEIPLEENSIRVLLSLLIEDVMEEAFSRLVRSGKEKLDLESVKRVAQEKAEETLQLYRDLVRHSKEVEAGMLPFLKEGASVTDLEKEKITQSLQRRAGKAIFAYAQEVRNMVETQAENFPALPSEAFGQLHEDLEMLRAIIEAMYKQTGRLDIESLRGLDFGYDARDKQSVLEVAKENYPGNSEVEKQVRENLQAALENPDAEVPVLKKGNEILAYMYFLKKESLDEKEHIYAGGLNVNPKFHGLGIGDIFIERMVIEKAQNFVVDAVMVPSVELLERHLEKTGFVITGMKKNDDGSFFYIVELDQEKNKALSSKHEDIQNRDAYKKIEFNERTELTSSEKEEEVQKLLDDGFVGTRYLRSETGFILLFEKRT
ncbi:MAG: hypothetical protein COV59_01160 [Candidatus Magasanikbacteria bacterium CG11_big_fil_rev_8_21_14_0_20_39_34]|uniref:N-acetyltransferase domain-containing protein n=1 Tax=Candidatus Magasanikbacteria bacterium CG11_big_fil_rev_8_21_14_0_20_39_34 TaxID=1974653 RepID=A0A2H0N6A8_9BACT|nr:MAG: hypothetical protein COV59_01160 [Candidatus Magasanikbacteria bacterium CG11_big_fil_rev_8_21_14_0_20_39_34]